MANETIIAAYHLAVACAFLLPTGGVSLIGCVGLWRQRQVPSYERDLHWEFMAVLGAVFTFGILVWIAVAGQDLLEAYLGVTAAEAPAGEGR